MAGWSPYLGVHQEAPHQGHGLLQRVFLRGEESWLLLLQGLGSAHHEAGDLVVQAVEGLHGW